MNKEELIRKLFNMNKEDLIEHIIDLENKYKDCKLKLKETQHELKETQDELDYSLNRKYNCFKCEKKLSMEEKCEHDLCEDCCKECNFE